MEAIAQYGSSDEEEETPSQISNQFSEPIPNAATDSNLEISTNHKGRIRSFPHVPGNFAVHVYIDIPVPDQHRLALENLLLWMKQHIPDLEPVQYEASLPPPLSFSSFFVQPSYHVSLSHTVPIRLPQGDPLLTSLRNSLVKLERFSLEIQPCLQVFLNTEKTRTFLALKVAAAPTLMALLAHQRQLISGAQTDPLVKAIHAISDEFELQDLPRFYSEPNPHISVAWLLGDQVSALEAVIKRATQVEDSPLRQLAALEWRFEPETYMV